MDPLSKASKTLAEILEQSLSKDPALAAKQRRLLESIKDGTFSERLAASSSSDPSAQQTPKQPQPETEADSMGTGDLRRLKALQKSLAPLGRT